MKGRATSVFWICFLLALLGAAPPLRGDSLVVVTSSAAQGANDALAWSQLGVDATTLSSAFVATSAQNMGITVGLTGANSLTSVVCSATPCSWTGTGFSSGDTLLWTSDAGNGGNGPLTLTFAQAVSGAGALIQADGPGPFTAEIQAFNGATMLGSFTVASNANGDAAYIGVSDQTGSNITSVTFSLTSCAALCADFAVDTVAIASGPSFPLTVTLAGNGSGKVSSTPVGINCPSVCSANFTSGQSVTLTAAANSNSNFAGWSGTCSGTGTCTVSMTSNQAVTATFTAVPGSSTIVTSSLNPAVVGQTLTLIGTVTPQNGGTATGTVTFYDGGIVIGSGALSGNTASITASFSTAGSHSITAVYGGDTNFTGSTSSPITQTVNKATTTIGLVSSPNPSLINQAVTFTATVTGQYGGTPTGSVTFKQGTLTLSTVTLVNAQASYTTIYTTSGTRSISATYSGDGNFTGTVSATLKQVVNKVSTTTTVTSSQDPSSVGQSITFTATVSPANTGLGLPSPSGTVTFKDGTTTLGTGTLSGGVATFTISSLTAGTHNITGSYGGDTNYLGSTSSKLSQVVNGLATTTTLSSSLNPSTYGQSVMFTATVIPNSGTGVPTGTVTFKSGTATLATVSLSGGTASYSTTTLTVGTKSITAVYSGDATYATSTSAVLSQVINKATTTTALTSSQNPSTSGQSVTFTATVSPQYSGIPTGSVTFKLGTSTLATVTVSGGVATYTSSTLPTGSDSIKASYNGSGNFNSSSASITQTVN